MMTKPMVMELISTQMVLNTKASGKKINKMVKERRLGLMEPVTLVNINKVKSLVMENSNGQTDLSMRDSSLKTISMEKVRFI